VVTNSGRYDSFKHIFFLDSGIKFEFVFRKTKRKEKTCVIALIQEIPSSVALLKHKLSKNWKFL